MFEPLSPDMNLRCVQKGTSQLRENGKNGASGGFLFSQRRDSQETWAWIRGIEGSRSLCQGLN